MTMSYFPRTEAEKRVYEHAFATHSERFTVGLAAHDPETDHANIARECKCRAEDAVRRWRLAHPRRKLPR